MIYNDCLKSELQCTLEILAFHCSLDFKNSITVRFPNISDFEHCLKFNIKVWFSDTFFKMCLKMELICSDFRHLLFYLMLPSHWDLKYSKCLKSELLWVWISDTLMCLKSELFGNKTVIECMRSTSPVFEQAKF